jgi:hypothetical protein
VKRPHTLVINLNDSRCGALGLTHQTIGPLVAAARQPPPQGHSASLEDAIAGAIHHHTKEVA